jgi:YVTN family beta-propeller protein
MGIKRLLVGLLFLCLSLSNSHAEELPTQAQTSTFTLAYQGPLTGPESEVGIAQYTGVKFAVTKFTASNPKMNIRVTTVDDQGDPVIANQVAPSIAANASIIGLIGPAYSSPAKTSLPYYIPSLLPIITPSASNEDLTNQEMYRSAIFHRVVPTYFYRAPNTTTSEGSVLIRRAASQTPINKIFIVRDDPNLPLAKDLIATLSALGASNEATLTLGSGNLTESDFTQAAATLKAGGAASIVFAGYSAFNAAGLVKALKIGGYGGKYFLSSLTNALEFKDLATSYGNGVELISDSIPLKDASASLAREFASKMGSPASLFATEAINATNIFLSGIKAGVTTRQGMSNYIDTFKGTGVAGNVIQFTASGELVNPSWGTYTVTNSQLVYKGLISVSTFAGKATQTITFALPNTLISAQFPYPLTTSASSGLPVTVTSNAPGVCTVSGNTLTLVSVGRCSLTASQEGNNFFSPARSVSRTISLTKATQTITFAPPSSLTSAQFPYTLTATASSGLPVTVTSSTTGVCTVSGFTLTLVRSGRCSLAANQPGDSNYGGARSVTRSITITKVPQTITFAPPINLRIGASPYSLSATANSGLPVSLVSSTPLICIVVGSNLNLVAKGNCLITASQSGDSVYAPASSIKAKVVILENPSFIVGTKYQAGRYSQGLAINRDTAYVTNSNDGTVSAIDLTNGTSKIFTIGGNPWCIRIYGQRAYISDLSANKISVVSLSTFKVIGTINVVGPYHFLIEDGKIFVAGGHQNEGGPDNKLSVFELSTLRLINSVPVGGNPASVTVSNNLAYITNTASTHISVIDLTTYSALENVYLPGSPIAAFAANGNLYVTLPNRNTLAVISLENRRLIREIAVGTSPFGINVLNSAYAFVTNGLSDDVSVIDLSTNLELARIAIGDYPNYVVFDRSQAYVLYSGDGQNLGGFTKIVIQGA